MNLQSDFPMVYDRILEAAGCRTQVELAQFLNLKQSSISDAKRRQSIPADWLLCLLRKKGFNPDWLLTGRGARYLVPCAPCDCRHSPADTPQHA